MFIESFSVAGIDSSDTGSIELMLLDPLATLREGLDEIEKGSYQL